MPAICEFTNTPPTPEAIQAHLPMSRNPRAYLGNKNAKADVPKGMSSHFGERGIREASKVVIRPSSAVGRMKIGDLAQTPDQDKYPLKLLGVAPADQVPVAEVRTTPRSAVRAFVSKKSDSQGIIIYQSRENGAKNFDRPL